MSVHFLKSLQLDRKTLSVWLLCTSIIGTTFLVKDSTWLYISALLPDLIQIKALSTLLLVSFALLISLYFVNNKLKSKININDYEFIEESGTYIHNSSEQLVCTSCLLSSNVISPLKTQENGWKCQMKDCGALFTSPDRRPNKVQRKVISKGVGGFANRW